MVRNGQRNSTATRVFQSEDFLGEMIPKVVLQWLRSQIPPCPWSTSMCSTYVEDVCGCCKKESPRCSSIMASQPGPSFSLRSLFFFIFTLATTPYFFYWWSLLRSLVFIVSTSSTKERRKPDQPLLFLLYSPLLLFLKKSEEIKKNILLYLSDYYQLSRK